MKKQNYLEPSTELLKVRTEQNIMSGGIGTLDQWEEEGID